jgi:hypothetical protein
MIAPPGIKFRNGLLARITWTCAICFMSRIIAGHDFALAVAPIFAFCALRSRRCLAVRKTVPG